MENQGFIEQTANDYAMPIHEVEKIYKLYPNQCYEKLEEFISERTNNVHKCVHVNK